MKAAPRLGVGTVDNRSERRTVGFESRRWPIEDSRFVGSLFAGNLANDLIDHLSDLPRAATPPKDPFLACLDDIRGRYLHVHGLRGNLHYEENAAGLGVPESPLRSILEHLVEGALRDNPADEPFCHVGVASRDDEFVTMYLRDNGRELPECSLEALRRFVRESKITNVPDRVYRLLLADNLVQWLGGRMWIGPTPNGNGSSVFLRLPRAKAQ